jgi:hypothetical protein
MAKHASFFNYIDCWIEFSWVEIQFKLHAMALNVFIQI